MILGACTGAAVPPTTVVRPVDPEAAVAEFVACMGDNGVALSFPDGASPGTTVSDAATSDTAVSDASALASLFAGVDVEPDVLAAAVDRCAGILADLGVIGSADDEALQVATEHRLEIFAACVRLRGVEGFPGPVGGRIPVDRVPFDDPDLPAAVDACRPTLPPVTAPPTAVP